MFQTRIENHTMVMEALGGRERTIRVLLPDGYDQDNSAYPVLYMHDGQNLFDDRMASYGKSWGIKETVEALGLHVIVVGIDNAGDIRRLDEYCPYINYRLKYSEGDFIYRNVGGEGEAYGRFLVEQLVPFIDTHYRTLKAPAYRLLAGSSMGGVISLTVGLSHQAIFGKIAAFSSALWFAENDLFHFMDDVKDEGLQKVYLDTGTHESSLDEDMSKIYVSTNQAMYRALTRVFGPERVQFVLEQGAIHNEAAWEKRFKEMIVNFLNCHES